MFILLWPLVALAVFIIGNRLWCFWCRSKVCLVGKTAIVTGGGAGIGFQVALALASKGCRVIIADIANISQAVKEIIKETHNPNVIGKKVDLSSYKSVREFSKEILDTEKQLNVLICNAGTGDITGSVQTEDGLEKTMQVNYFSHFLLTHLLLDLLQKSAPSRIVYTGSQLAYISNMKIETMNTDSDYVRRFRNNIQAGAYGNSKLCLAAATIILGKKLKGTGVTANIVHPGGVKTDIFSRAYQCNKDRYVQVIGGLVYLYGKTPEQGAQTILHVAQCDSVKDVTGESFIEGKRVPRPFKLYNEDFCQKIWDMSIKYTKLETHEIKY